MVAGAIDDTLIVDVANLPSDAANTIAVPAPIAVTVPSGATVSTVGAPEDHVTTRSASTLPPASSATADRRVLPPINSALVAGETRNAAIGDGATITVAEPTFPSLAIVIVAVPGADVVTKPSTETCATLTFELL